MRSQTPLFAHSDRSQKRRPRLSSRHSTIAHDGSAGPQRSGFACHTQFTACTGSATSTAVANLCRRTRKKSFWQHIEHSRCMSFRVSSHICEHFKTIHQLHLSSHRYQLTLYDVHHHENPDSTREECVQSSFTCSSSRTGPTRCYVPPPAQRRAHLKSNDRFAPRRALPNPIGRPRDPPDGCLSLLLPPPAAAALLTRQVAAAAAARRRLRHAA